MDMDIKELEALIKLMDDLDPEIHEIVNSKLEKAGVETEMILVGKEKIQGCIACHGCVKNQNEACSIKDDPVNEWIQKIKEADGILLGSPVHFAGVAGTMKSFLDRAFFVSLTRRFSLPLRATFLTDDMRSTSRIPSR